VAQAKDAVAEVEQIAERFSAARIEGKYGNKWALRERLMLRQVYRPLLAYLRAVVLSPWRVLRAGLQPHPISNLTNVDLAVRRRPQDPPAIRPVKPAPKTSGDRRRTRLSDPGWALLEPEPAQWRAARAENGLGIHEPIHGLREIVNAILYLNRTAMAWAYLPHDVPPASTLYGRRSCVGLGPLGRPASGGAAYGRQGLGALP